MLSPEFTGRVNELKPDLVVFSVVRNEMLRLPSWLRHYRNAGVTCFAVIDNGSADGTFEMLSEQPDVVVTRLTESYAASHYGIDWLNEFHASIMPGIWVLFADSDELLVYRGWPKRPLIALAREAQSAGSNAVFGFMLDMYPDGPLEAAAISSDPFDAAPCFDREYDFQLRPQKPWEQPQQILEVIGGPRVRMLSSLARERAATWFTHFLRGQIDRVLPVTPDRLVPWVVRLMPKQMPSLIKLPLVLAGSGVSYLDNAHDGAGARLYRENVVFCHFKFLSDFAKKVREEAARGEHFRRGAEYIMYANAISRRGELDLRYEGTRTFKGADQLIDLGLIRDIRPILA